MAIITGVIKEEHERLLLLKNKYLEILADYPIGTISKKKRFNQSYVYLVRKISGKLVFKYIGNEGNPEAIELVKKIEERKNYEKKLKETQKELKEVEKLLNAG